ncbi:MAG: ATP-binding cassette domain-containing protein [Burkholderiaceae bacterium]
MIRFKSITLSRGGSNLLFNADASVSPGERLALIGPNGSGKTTLLKALVGEVLPDAGDIEMPTMAINLLQQHAPRSTKPGWRYVLDSDEALTSAQSALDNAQASDDGMAIASALDAWQLAGGDTAEARCRELLNGLGFDNAQTELPVDALSGGWRMRLNLARVLFRPCDLLMLDEPTNHLDLDAVLWLERHLLRHDATILIVSHDRDFLDAVVNGTLSIEDASLRRYKGGYSACEAQRAQRIADTERQSEQTKREADRLQSFVDRFRAQATKARQVQSRIKAMEKLVISAPLNRASRLNLKFDDVGRMPDPVVYTEDMRIGYGDVSILNSINLKVERGARIGILGRNGGGKTTLIRSLTGELPLLGGECHRSPQVRVGYFAQDAVDFLRADDSALDHLRREAAKHAPQPPADGELRKWLGRFAFRDEDAIRPVGPMSGGERARLVLSMILWVRPQLLVLDEPTNHLDAATRDALTDALLDFDGVLMLVSHDRYLLRACVDRFILVRDGSAEEFDGDLDDYARWLRQQDKNPGAKRSNAEKQAQSTDSTNDESNSKSNRKADRQAAASRRNQHATTRRPIQKELGLIEKQMATLEAQLSALAIQLGDPSFYNDPDKSADSLRQHSVLDTKQQALEARWLELTEALEAMDRPINN